jgi:hypothetical protein
MKKSALNILEEWFLQNCDGDWEHSYGIQIETLDNPGWFVTIDLEETFCETKELVPQAIERSTTDWFYCRVRNKRFEGAGGVKNLNDILQFFYQWVNQ